MFSSFFPFFFSLFSKGNGYFANAVNGLWKFSVGTAAGASYGSSWATGAQVQGIYSCSLSLGGVFPM
jgi:hypothetical protein